MDSNCTLYKRNVLLILNAFNSLFVWNNICYTDIDIHYFRYCVVVKSNTLLKLSWPLRPGIFGMAGVSHGGPFLPDLNYEATGSAI